MRGGGPGESGKGRRSIARRLQDSEAHLQGRPPHSETRSLRNRNHLSDQMACAKAAMQTPMLNAQRPQRPGEQPFPGIASTTWRAHPTTERGEGWRRMLVPGVLNRACIACVVDMSDAPRCSTAYPTHRLVTPDFPLPPSTRNLSWPDMVVGQRGGGPPVGAVAARREPKASPSALPRLMGCWRVAPMRLLCGGGGGQLLLASRYLAHYSWRSWPAAESGILRRLGYVVGLHANRYVMAVAPSSLNHFAPRRRSLASASRPRLVPALTVTIPVPTQARPWHESSVWLVFRVGGRRKERRAEGGVDSAFRVSCRLEADVGLASAATLLEHPIRRASGPPP